MKFDHAHIDKKWQEIWQKGQFHTTKTDGSEHRYILDMFPYPSGSGLHVGHVAQMVATDALHRMSVMNGINVLRPQGFDAFGLPAENYAIKTGVHPSETTDTAIAKFTSQMNSLGFAYDWDRKVVTSKPEYYRWTQWLFLQLFERGLAYKKEAPVNWCPGCKTVLANEQVVAGECERCGSKVVQKNLSQWFFKITDYSDALLEGLDEIDWPEKIKAMQRNWIGRSKGAEVQFAIESSEEHMTVFTTRPDTLFGATYVVLSPEHPLVDIVTTEDQREAVTQYKEEASHKTELQRSMDEKKKTGVFTGSFATNPVNGARLPIWVADYVLMNYGTGAVMAVPAHDERDFEFAKKFDLPIIEVVKGGNVDEAAFVDDGEHVASDFLNGMNTEDAKQAMIEWLEKQNVGSGKTRYKIRDWLVSRQRYWGTPIPVVYDPEGNAHPVKEEHLPLTLPMDVDFKPTGTSPIAGSEEFARRAEELYGKGWRFETDTMDTFVCSSWYFLRYTDPKNADAFASADALKTWMPVDMYVGGAEHAVMHLLYARFFTRALYDMNLSPIQEPFKVLKNQGTILGPDGEKMSKSKGNVVNPDDIVEKYGADTLRLYEMFMGPFEESKPWDDEGIKGVRRFLERVMDLPERIVDQAEKDVVREYHATVKKVTEDIPEFKFNTSIAQMMKFINVVQANNGIDRDMLNGFARILFAFAPHTAEEINEQNGGTESLWKATWPTFDETLIAREEMNIAVSVNGKVRATISMPSAATQDDVERTAKENPNVQKFLTDEVKKTVYVPGKLINFVI